VKCIYIFSHTHFKIWDLISIILNSIRNIYLEFNYIKKGLEFKRTNVNGFNSLRIILDDPSDLIVLGVGLRPLACWDWGFESRRRHGCLPLVNVVCCQVYASGWTLVQRSPTECGVSECDRDNSKTRRPWPNMGPCAMEKEDAFQNHDSHNETLTIVVDSIAALT
jgi:hypothetical protein